MAKTVKLFRSNDSSIPDQGLIGQVLYCFYFCLS